MNSQDFTPVAVLKIVVGVLTLIAAGRQVWVSPVFRKLFCQSETKKRVTEQKNPNASDQEGLETGEKNEKDGKSRLGEFTAISHTDLVDGFTNLGFESDNQSANQRVTTQPNENNFARCVMFDVLLPTGTYVQKLREKRI